MNRITDLNKIDVGLVSANLNGAGTGPYYRMDKYRKAVFAVEYGAMAAGVTSEIQIMQATDAEASGAKVLTAGVATVNANTNVSSALLTSGAVHVATDEYTVNGLTFTAAADDVEGSRTYAIGANQTDSTLNLANKINDPVIGVPGVTATADAGVLTLTATEPGDVSITISASAGAVGVPSTASAVAFVECDASTLDSNNSFSHVAVRVTNSAATLTGSVLVRGEGRYSPSQNVAASTAI